MRVRVTGIKQYRDRHGKLRRYYRRKGAPSVPISIELKGQALAAEIARLDALYKPLTPVAGTLAILINEYQAKSQHWRKLRDRTQQDYERVFKWMGKSKDFPLTGITTPALARLKDKAADQHGFKFANQVTVTLKMVFSYGVEYGHIASNPAADVTPVARPAHLPEANRPWQVTEAVEMLKAPIHIAAPIAVAAYLGIREGDVLKMSRAAIADRLLSLTTSKTRRALELPVCDDLWAILTRYQSWRKALFDGAKRDDTATTFFISTRGRPWTSDGFRTSFGKWRDDRLKEGKVGAGITFHGARHTVATILAETGFEQDKVKHLLGHGSETITEHYSRRAKRRAMLKEMAEAVQLAYRIGGENVVNLDRIENGSV